MQEIFKNRILEEAFQDKFDSALNKGKQFVKNNPYLSIGAGGAAAGALMNYLGDGADHLATSRQNDIDEFIDKDARAELAAKATLDKDVITDVRDAAIQLDHRSSTPNPFPWITGTVEDAHPFRSDIEAENVIKNMQHLHPEIQVEYLPKELRGSNLGTTGMKVGDYTLNLFSRSDDDVDKYNYGIKNKFLDLSKEEIEKQIGQDKELAGNLKNMRAGLDHTTRDSYLQKALGGAALGSAGVFAKRKLDERKRY